MLKSCRFNLYRTSRGAGWTQPHMTNTDGIYSPPRDQTHDPRNSRRRSESVFQHATRLAMENTFESRDGDDRMYGGNNATQKAHAYNELKHFDRRIATPFHPELTMNVLKNASFYTGPNGQIFTNDFLEGRLVGLCIVSETQRSMNFMNLLSVFTKQHRGDFVPIVMSGAKDEMEQQAFGAGLFYLSHVRGSALVKRDLGLNTGRFVPLPRLCVIDGSTGFVITTSGYTAIKVKPETCFSAWIQGESGVSFTDYPLGWF